MEYNQVAAKSSSVLTSEEEYDEELDLYRNKLILATKASSDQQTPQTKLDLKKTKATKPVKVKQNEPQEDTAAEGGGDDYDTQSQVSVSQESATLSIKSDSRQSSQSAAHRSKKRKNISSEYIYDSDDEELDSRLRNQDLRKSGKRTIVTHLKKSGFHKVLRLSEHLQKIVGSDTASRVEVVKALHVYVKANNLQDPNDGRYIICDENIKAICKVKRISMFKINAHLSKHLFDLDDLNATVTEDDDDDHDDTDQDIDSVDNDASSVASSISSLTSGDYAVDKFERIKSRRSKKSTSSSVKNNKKRRKPAVKQGATTPKRFKAKLLSPQLQAIVQKERLSNFDVNKHLWAYVKEHKLQDPKDGRYILCDDKLKAVFKSNRVHGFSMQKVLIKHIWDAQDESSSNTLPPIAENQ